MVCLIYILIILAAIFNATTDILKDKFSQSIFYNLDPYFWNPNESWKNKYKDRDKLQGRKYPSYLSGFTDTFSDAWHISKFLMLCCMFTAIYLPNKFNFLDLLIYFIIWGATFKLFYTKLLIR